MLDVSRDHTERSSELASCARSVEAGDSSEEICSSEVLLAGDVEALGKGRGGGGGRGGSGGGGGEPGGLGASTASLHEMPAKPVLHSHEPSMQVPWPLQFSEHMPSAVPQSSPVYPSSHVQPKPLAALHRTPPHRGPQLP